MVEMPRMRIGRQMIKKNLLIGNRSFLWMANRSPALLVTSVVDE